MFNSAKAIPKQVWLIALGHGVTDLAPGALYVALPFFKAQLGLTYAEVSMIVLVQNMTASLSQPIFGYFSDRTPRPWIMPIGCLVCGVAMLASLLVPSYYGVLLFMGLSGFGNAAFHPEAAKVVNQLSGKSLGKGASLFSVWGNFGVGLGTLFMAFLLAANGNISLYFFILPFLLCTVALCYVAATLPSAQFSGVSGLRQLKASVNGALLCLLGMIAARATISSGISAFVPLYYVSYLHGSSLYASSLLTVYMIAGAFGTMIGGLMSDRYGSKTVMLYSILPLALLMYGFRFMGGIWPFVILALMSILLTATATSSLVLIQKMMPGNVGMASGLNLGFSVGLGTLGVLALGKVADLWSMPVIFDILAFLPIIAFALTCFIREPGWQERSGIMNLRN
ncbi:FSR family fosmidomycin resistance protein-like MFS transporter [Sporomusaceae bacterium BoRhaA]|uniref:MFS transporter n=1 Tax=Pelorhabdus rhamnosifermentans TaxID=2772457 RepID=UPI001C063EAA|nr:MFS transporter [Pelorhabdus rhamnosifermentans]MBU2699408.1 FSR family fosmidomycin resistance protein-like MFS transporter [Pelorhabdus rhamnosifermentans]